MVKRDVWHRRPSFLTRSISALCRRKRRRDVERPGISGIRPKDDRYTAKRARPFARRRARTFRPFLVLMRLRNPWSLFRFRFEGCLNVADMKRLQCSQNRLHHIGGSLTLSMKACKRTRVDGVRQLWRFCSPPRETATASKEPSVGCVDHEIHKYLIYFVCYFVSFWYFDCSRL